MRIPAYLNIVLLVFVLTCTIPLSHAMNNNTNNSPDQIRQVAATATDRLNTEYDEINNRLTQLENNFHERSKEYIADKLEILEEKLLDFHDKIGDESQRIQSLVAAGDADAIELNRKLDALDHQYVVLWKSVSRIREKNDNRPELD